MSKILLALPLALLFLATSAYADLVRLKNGKVLEGKITEEDAGSVSLEIGKAFMKLQRSRIDWVIKGKKEDIERKAKTGNAFLDGMGALKFENFEEAASQFEKALSLEPRNLEIQANLAYAYARSGSPEKAIPLYRQALEGNRFNRGLRMNLVSAYADAGQNRQAAEQLHAMLDDFPSDRQLHEKLSIVFHKAGLYTQSVLHAKKAAKLASTA